MQAPCVAGVLSPFSIIFSEIIGPFESKFLEFSIGQGPKGLI